MRLRRTLLASIIGLFGILGIPASSIAALSLQPVSGSAIIPREIASVQTERATEPAAANLFFPKKAHIGVIGENLAETRLSLPPLAADSQQVALSKWLYNASGYTVAPESGGWAVDDLATTPLTRHLSDLPDDAIVHFGPEGFSTIRPGAGGEVFAFRFGDIKHLTPRQIETLAGPLSRAGQKGGSRVMHILDEPLDNAVRRSVPGTDISEIVFDKAIKVIEGFIVQ